MPRGLTERDIILKLNSISDSMAFDSDEGGNSDAEDFHPNVKSTPTTLKLDDTYFFRVPAHKIDLLPKVGILVFYYIIYYIPNLLKNGFYICRRCRY